MSEGLPAGSMSLEADDTTAPVQQTTEIVNPPIAPNEDTEPEGTVTTQTGQKMVPLSALQAERGQRKEAQKTLNELKPKAEEYDRVKDKVAAVMPLIQKVQGRPDVLRMLDQPAPAAKPSGPLSDEQAIEYARDFDLYKTDGSPDVDRAQRIAQRNVEMNARATQQIVAPLIGNEAQRQSQGLYQHYANMTMADGMRVDPNILAEMWRNVPPEQSANPAVANVLYLTAIGEMVRQGKSPKPGPGPVVTTEGVGPRATAVQTITQLDSQIIKAAGISEKDYKETSARFKPGQANYLE